MVRQSGLGVAGEVRIQKEPDRKIGRAFSCDIQLILNSRIPVK